MGPVPVAPSMSSGPSRDGVALPNEEDAPSEEPRLATVEGAGVDGNPPSSGGDGGAPEVAAAAAATAGARLIVPEDENDGALPKEAPPSSSPLKDIKFPSESEPPLDDSDLEAPTTTEKTTLRLWDDDAAAEDEAWAVLFALGVVLRVYRPGTAADFVLAFGLFAFAGGITNWLAVKMLFDKIPGLFGSGVIPRRFQEILGALKEMILETFFEERFLHAYINDRSKKRLWEDPEAAPQASFVEKLDLRHRLEAAMTADGFDETLSRKLETLSATPEGLMLATLAPMFGGFDTMVPMIKPMLLGVGVELVGTLAASFNPDDFLDVKAVRSEIDRVLTQRMDMLTPKKVKRMMSNVIRNHLGWLVVWGNVFGGFIGVLSWAADY